MVNPGLIQAPFPGFRSIFAQKPCSFTHFSRKYNILGIQAKQSVLHGAVKR